MILSVVKRDGTIEPFDYYKIEKAILKAFDSVDENVKDEYETLAYNIAHKIGNEVDKQISVEEIQDIVEQELMASDRKDVAKAYIIYRNERTKEREKKSELAKKIKERLHKTVNERSNANVDEESFSGREKEISGDVAKSIALDYGEFSDDVAQAHKDMLIYQHDLDKAIYGEHNCLFVNFQELFENGFKTRNGDVRPPSSFSTACQQMAVAFQCQSQIQYGGCASMHCDIDLAPFVRKSFYHHFKEGSMWLSSTEFYKAFNADYNNLKKKNDVSIADFMEYIHKQYEINDDDNVSKVYDYAMYMLKQEMKQSAEALFHNLSTLESRQGSQVPFTSLDYGRDTSMEGRMVSEALLNASISGIGKHHLTSIFPISIFQYKAGTNANPEDKNYDLKQLALESMSKRIYPNWVNCNWSQGNEIEDEPDSWVATMGKCKCSPFKIF